MTNPLPIDMIEPTEPDCSPGARMLIDRMKDHPDEFTYGKELWDMVQQARAQVEGREIPMTATIATPIYKTGYEPPEHRLPFTPRDAKAIWEAATAPDGLLEYAFTRHMVERLTGPSEEEKRKAERDAMMQSRISNAVSSMKSTLGTSIFGSNHTTPLNIGAANMYDYKQLQREAEEFEYRRKLEEIKLAGMFDQPKSK